MTKIDDTGIIDHLVYGVLDLQQAVDDIERQIGVRPVEGGRHIGRGTRNYLLGLSPTCYLEIIALDADNPVGAEQTVAFALDTLDRDRMVTWAVHPGDIDGALVKSRRHGADHGKLAPMSRVNGNGNELEWTLAVADDLPYAGLAPFLIDWGNSIHPAASGIPLAAMVELTITSPDADTVNRLYADLRLDITAEPGEAAMRAVIRGPAGTMPL